MDQTAMHYIAIYCNALVLYTVLLLIYTVMCTADDRDQEATAVHQVQKETGVQRSVSDLAAIITW